MDRSSILSLIRENPQLPYEEAQKQALDAGLPQADFDGAWAEAHPDQKGIDGHDRRVGEILDEMRKLGKVSKTREEWKAYFLAKGYLDDECDLAWVLDGAKINYGPLPPKTMVGLLVGIGLAAVFLLAPRGESVAVYLFGLVPSAIYFAYLSSQFQKYSWRAIETDFKATQDPNPFQHFSEWKRAGAEFLGRSDGRISALFEAEYDKRPIHFGVYQYTEGSGKHRRTIECFVVVQKTRTTFPHVLCRKVYESGVMLGRKKVQLEGTDFNKQYNVYTEKPSDAFYVLNPRAMSALLEKSVVARLRSFESAGDLIVFVFTGISMHTGIHLSGPVIKFKDYQLIKSQILAHLDLATNVNDVLSREIVDNGERRSEAKNK